MISINRYLLSRCVYIFSAASVYGCEINRLSRSTLQMSLVLVIYPSHLWLYHLFDKSVCVYSNANSLHYYVLRVARKADRWHWVLSIFNSRTAWADHITCGTSICIVYPKVGIRMTVCLTVCVVLCCVGWWKKGRRWNPVLAHSLLFTKSTKGAAGLNVPIRRKNRYQQYYMPS